MATGVVVEEGHDLDRRTRQRVDQADRSAAGSVNADPMTARGVQIDQHAGQAGSVVGVLAVGGVLGVSVILGLNVVLGTLRTLERGGSIIGLLAIAWLYGLIGYQGAIILIGILSLAGVILFFFTNSVSRDNQR